MVRMDGVWGKGEVSPRARGGWTGGFWDEFGGCGERGGGFLLQKGQDLRNWVGCFGADSSPLKDMFPVMSEQILVGSKFLRQ